MKQSQVKPGVRAMLSLGGRRGAVAVTVVELFTRAGYTTYDGSVTIAQAQWRCQDSLGRWHVATARKLQPMPAPTDRHGDLILASMRRDALKLAPAQPGQTIDNGDTVITTTLHRLG